MINRKKEIDELVESMMQKTTNNPRDYCFNYIVSRYPKVSHEVFGFPGKFIKSLDRIAYKEDGLKLELDIAELVEKDEFIKQKSTINVEHQTTPIEYGKIDPIYDYKIHLIHENNLPSISIVITSIEQEKQMKCYESQNNVFNVYYIEVKEKDICEKLNILRNITNSEEISQKEAIYFTYIVIFVDRNIDKRIVEEISHIFMHVKMNSYLRLDIHHVLKIMIKEIFKDNKQKTRELLTMITKTLNEKEFCELTREEQFKADIARKDELIENRDEMLAKKDEMISEIKTENEKKISEIKTENEKRISEKDKEISEIKTENEKKISEKDKEIYEKDKEIYEKDVMLAKKDEELEILRLQIKQQNSKQ